MNCLLSHLSARLSGLFFPRNNLKDLALFPGSSQGQNDPVLKVETSAVCNARCIWCWMFNANKVKPGLMSFESFKKIVDMNQKFLVEGSWRIEPYFRGESLLNPELFDMLDYLLEKGIGLTQRFDTNLSVQIDIKRLMSYPWGEIWVNLGGLTKQIHERVMRNTCFELVIQNLKDMIETNNEIVCIKMNPTRHNVHQIDHLESFFNELGGKAENIRSYTTSFPIPNAASLEEKRQFFHHVVSEEVRPFLRFEYDLDKEDYGIKAKRKGCNFMMPCIFHDGTVTLCCHDFMSEINAGNAFNTPLDKIITSRQCLDLRAKCLSQDFFFCKECN